ncbi:serine/threonine-protein kinase [Streptomyces sp. NPDC006326]|uniref:serine/threonine-protein kinase n=1 Tax=Streptomyces sp. NPDC006326 TaxID=3156752 RepID=UPI0033B89C53
MAGTDVFPAKLAERYRPSRVLGRGGMGVVFAAEDTRLRRPVAVKILSAFGTSPSQETLRRFVSEAIALARIRHPGVVGIYDSGVDRDSGTPYLVMELLDGIDLSALAGGSPLPVAAACRIAVEMLGALEAAHRSGVLHRDVKPGNVRIGRDGRVVLYDFGLAVVAEEPRITTAGGKLVGTAQYMAPERIHGVAPSGATDLYSVGACLHFMLTGSPPFGSRPMDFGVLVLKAAKGVPSLREHRLPLPDGLLWAVDSLCAVDPRGRPLNAAEAAATLRPWAAGGEQQVVELLQHHQEEPPRDTERVRHPGRRAVEDSGVWQAAPPEPVPAFDWQDVDVADGEAAEAPSQLSLSDPTRRLVHSRMTERTALSRQREAVVLVQRGEFRQAAQLLAGVTPYCHESLGASHPTTLACQYWQAVCQARLGEPAAALELFARVSTHIGNGTGEERI